VVGGDARNLLCDLGKRRAGIFGGDVEDLFFVGSISAGLNWILICS